MDRRKARLVHWSRGQLALRSARRWARRLERLGRWAIDPSAYPTAPIASDPARHGVSWWRGAVSLARCGADPRLERGKVQNLAVAAVAIDGRVIGPDAGFSFWKLVGRPSASRGFALGAEVRAGCVVPTAGGGLCLLSNLIFRAAAELGWSIAERAGHTLAWSADDEAPDATVAWPDVDLRFEPPAPCRLAVAVRGDELVVEIFGAEPLSTGRCVLESEPIASASNHVVRQLWRRRPDGTRESLGRDSKRVLAPEQRGVSCLTCDEQDCHGRPRGLRLAQSRREPRATAEAITTP